MVQLTPGFLGVPDGVAWAVPWLVLELELELELDWVGCCAEPGEADDVVLEADEALSVPPLSHAVSDRQTATAARVNAEIFRTCIVAPTDRFCVP
ncbi:hypothetical protein GCM10010339_77800 [Streptomyces alanosinicus]|uniref:Uncharacterized protein n=1 Tax=Streptomyces alanosinicus TaxID=68171 RepID=A0A918YT49_9ACTN|nr:hypothetical protein GCM10010339_77800 [Streptomyces alanosinicus]